MGLIVLSILFFILSGQNPVINTRQANLKKVSQESKAQIISSQKDCKIKNKLLTSVKQINCTESDEFLYSTCGGYFE